MVTAMVLHAIRYHRGSVMNYTRMHAYRLFIPGSVYSMRYFKAGMQPDLMITQY